MPRFELHVNGDARTVDVGDPNEPLLYVLRNTLGLTGAKFGCGLGQCGACTVLDRRRGRCAPASCPVSRRRSARSTTIEGLGTPEKPHPLQAAFIAEQAAQCGYCATGMVMTGAALLAQKPERHAARRRKDALAGNLCRCGTHQRDPARGDARRGEGDGMNAHASRRRREFLQAGGALVVGFSLRRARRRRSALPAADAALGKTLDPAEVDGFLAIHADGTVTIFCGKVDLGPGPAHRDPADGGGGARHRRRADRDDRGRHRAHARPGADRRQHRHHARRRADPAGGGDRARGADRRWRRRARPAGRRVRRASTARSGPKAGGAGVRFGELVGGKRFDLKVDPKAPLRDPATYTVVGKPLAAPRRSGQGHRPAHVRARLQGRPACCTRA